MNLGKRGLLLRLARTQLRRGLGQLRLSNSHLRRDLLQLEGVGQRLCWIGLLLHRDPRAVGDLEPPQGLERLLVARLHLHLPRRARGLLLLLLSLLVLFLLLLLLLPDLRLLLALAGLDAGGPLRLPSGLRVAVFHAS